MRKCTLPSVNVQTTALLIFHTESWEQSSDAFAKCLFAIFLCFARSSCSLPLFVAIQWLEWIITSNELTVSCNCYQTFHYVSEIKQKGWVIGSLCWLGFVRIFSAWFSVASQDQQGQKIRTRNCGEFPKKAARIFQILCNRIHRLFFLNVVCVFVVKSENKCSKTRSSGNRWHIFLRNR